MRKSSPVPAGYSGGRSTVQLVLAASVLGVALLVAASPLPASYWSWLADLARTLREAMF